MCEHDDESLQRSHKIEHRPRTKAAYWSRAKLTTKNIGLR